MNEKKAKAIRKQIFGSHDKFIEAKRTRQYHGYYDPKNKFQPGPFVLLTGNLALYRVAKAGYNTGRFVFDKLQPISLPRPSRHATPPTPPKDQERPVIIQPTLKQVQMATQSVAT